jgi:acetyl/propionyl-CoA carboxylase alpha subunit
LLVANRGEIALRVLRTARELGIETVAVFSDVDRGALHVRRADIAHGLGGSTPAESYLDIEKILAAARRSGAQAIHPGYGFLSENPNFAAAVTAAGLVFVGPPAPAITTMGDKLAARRAAPAAGVPVVPGLDEESLEEASLIEQARRVGLPGMLKAAAGGGGKGIRIVEHESELAQAAALARAEAQKAFGDQRIYLEKYLRRPRHIEVQVFADSHGGVVAYGERECSVQRRHQKLVEESPSPALDPALRKAICAAAIRVTAAVGYRGAGTIEFLFSEGAFYFLEMNTRLQVEHGITEERYGVDLVAEQLRVAAGGNLAPVSEPRGHAIEVRVNAEDPDTFFPSLGEVRRLSLPGGPGVRIDSALYRGMEITAHYDSLLAKVIVWAPDRGLAIARMLRVLREFRIVGVTTSIPAAIRALESDAFGSANYDTGLLATLPPDSVDGLVQPLAVAAALHRYLGTGSSQFQRREPGPSAWVQTDRATRLGWRR